MTPVPEETSIPLTEAQAVPETFAGLGIRPEILAAIEKMGFSQPSLVQRAVFAPLMQGRDVIVQAETGSGKTAAFAIPMAQGLVTRGSADVEAIVLVPTRELALQVTEECRRVCQGIDIECLTVYGGAPIGPQIEALKQKVQVVVGTPGRVLDHLSRKTLSLGRVKFLVLDEADEMLSMGFWEAVTDIVKATPPARQTALFSATVPDVIERTAREMLRNPERILLSQQNISAASIRHAYCMVSGMGKMTDLARLLAIHEPPLAIVFCNTREECASVSDALRGRGVNAEAISGDLTQKERERVMGKMRSGDLSVLVATDVAARGIDITQVSHVINYSLPESLEVYIHRSGRTGRAGNAGTAISFISPQEIGQFYLLKLTYQIDFEELPLPSLEEEESAAQGRIILELEKAALQTSIPEPHWFELSRRVWTAVEHERLMAYALKSWWTTRNAPVPSVVPPAKQPFSQRPGLISSTLPAKTSLKRRTELPRSGSQTAETAAETPAGMVRVIISVGRKHGLQHSQLKKQLSILGLHPFRVHVRNDHSYFFAPAETSDAVKSVLANAEWQKTPFAARIES